MQQRELAVMMGGCVCLTLVWKVRLEVSPLKRPECPGEKSKDRIYCSGGLDILIRIV